MSSHHVIRDEQEPPIFILTANFNMTLVNDLLGWSPLLIVIEEVYPFFDASGIKVDIVIGSVNIDSAKYGGSRLVEIENLEDLSYPLLLQIIEGKSFTGVNIFCSSIVKNNLIRYVSLQVSDLTMPLAIFVADEKTIVSSKSKHSKWYPAGQRLKFNNKNISVYPAIVEKEGFYTIDVDGKYEFLIQDGLLVIAEY
jgi:thiamine pyrophosphokinase